VKLDNILLNARLEAKIADFGLSKTFNHDNAQVATNTIIAGTYGYMDPEYVNPVSSNEFSPSLFFPAPPFLDDQFMLPNACRYRRTGKPTTKSDVYSFGVVLLQLVAGRPATQRDPEPTSIVQWARPLLAQGNIEAVADRRMRGDHDINGVWKVADVALSCTAQQPAQRPSMTEVVAQLQECLELEKGGRAGGDTSGSFYTAGSGDYPYSGHTMSAARNSGVVSQESSSAYEMEVEHNLVGRVPTMPTGPAPR
jgi:serine/threonine protein kinase